MDRLLKIAAVDDLQSERELLAEKLKEYMGGGSNLVAYLKMELIQTTEKQNRYKTFGHNAQVPTLEGFQKVKPG